MSREDAQVAFAAVIVGGHVASVQESGDALEAIAQPRLQARNLSTSVRQPMREFTEQLRRS
jgi:hypothetical protein